MSKQYQVEAYVTYSGMVVVEADSAEEAKQIVLDEVQSFISVLDDELDYYDTEFEVVGEDEE